MTSPHQADSETQLAAILKSLDDDKAEDVVQIDLRGKTAMGDYMVIASGRSSRQVSAISESWSTGSSASTACQPAPRGAKPATGY